VQVLDAEEAQVRRHPVARFQVDDVAGHQLRSRPDRLAALPEHDGHGSQQRDHRLRPGGEGRAGAGKTSFLRAGVIASRGEGWAAVHATPGSNPALGLARGLTPDLAGDAEAIDQLLSSVTELAQAGEAARVVQAAKRWRSRHAEALLVVDQFEELFTLNPTPTQERFAALLGQMASEADVHVVLSLRDDFLIRCSDHAPLAPVFREITPLTALTPDGLRRAVVEPASRRGYGFEDEALVEEMVSAVEGVRGALPLLSAASGSGRRPAGPGSPGPDPTPARGACGLEVGSPEPQRDAAVEDRGSPHAGEGADHVRLAAGDSAVGCLRRVVRGEESHAVSRLVLGTTSHPVAPLDHEHAPSRRDQLVGHHRPPESAAHDDGVVLGDQRSPVA
jgi:hypothetical protein